MSGVSVIATVRNEVNAIQALLDSLAAQTRLPDEIVIVDGGSTDGTLEVLEQSRALAHRLRVVRASGANISAGRNIAIRTARHDVILVTDAGVILPETWVEHLATPLEQDPDLAMVGGFFESAPESLFEWALGATTLPLLDEVREDTFMPSHRSVAFRRSVWESLGGYPEWLDYCEDLLFDMRLRARGYRVAFEARALVAFRPRSSLKAFALQYFRYARGDGKAGILTKRHLIRYATYLVAALVPVTTGRLKVPVFAAASMAAIAYCGGPWRRLKRTQGGRPAGQLLMAMALVPWLRLTGDLAKMLGFPVGVRYRHRHGEGD